VFVNNKPVAVLMDVVMFEKWNTVFDFEKEKINQDEFVKYLYSTAKKISKT
jgi:hypothetical protein